MVGVEQDGGKSVLQKTQEHNQALYRQQQIDQQNAQTRQQRENAPGNIKEGTFEAQQVRKEESQDAQQAYFSGNFQQKGSSPDQLAAQREAALKSGKFDYGAVRSSFYSPPSNFVNTKGERVSRTDYKPPVKEPVISFGGGTSGTPIEKPNMPVLKISSSELQKSNALRASQGLPPLETVTTIQIVSPTKGPTQQPVSRLSTGGKAPVATLTGDTATLYGKTFSIFTPAGEKSSGAVVSFLRYPFSANKGSSSGGIQSTTILDPLQFLGIEAGASLIAKGASFVGSLIKSEGKMIIKEGAKDIGLNIKPSEAYLKAKSFESQASRLPAPASIRQVKTPTVPTFQTNEITLGKGLGRTAGKGGSTSTTDLFKPSSSGKPSSSTKEITVGKGGLTQMVREKPPIQKTVTLKEKPKFEQRQLQKQDQFLKQQLKSKTKQERILKQKQEQLVLVRPLQKQTQEFKQQSKQKRQQGIVIPISQNQTQTTRQPTEQKTTALLTQKQNQITRPKQTQRLTNPTKISSSLITIPPNNPTSKTTTDVLSPPTKTQQTPESPKRPQFDSLLGSAKSGGLGKVSKSGARKGYIGNVPIESLVGVYKRSEVTYTNKSASQINKKQKTATNRNFKLLGSKSIRM